MVRRAHPAAVRHLADRERSDGRPSFGTRVEAGELAGSWNGADEGEGSGRPPRVGEWPYRCGGGGGVGDLTVRRPLPLLHSVCPVQVAQESHEKSRSGSHVFCVDGVSSGRRRAAAAALSDPPITLPTPSPLLPNALVQHPTQERVRSSAGSAGETFDACLPPHAEARCRTTAIIIITTCSAMTATVPRPRLRPMASEDRRPSSKASSTRAVTENSSSRYVFQCCPDHLAKAVDRQSGRARVGREADVLPSARTSLRRIMSPQARTKATSSQSSRPLAERKARLTGCRLSQVA